MVKFLALFYWIFIFDFYNDIVILSTSSFHSSYLHFCFIELFIF